ncbi:MAG: YHS domain-containing (seleno)protein [Bacteroidota bacterium]
MQILLKTGILTVFLALAITCFSQDGYQLRIKQFNIDQYAVALQGYDVMSYFEGRPQKGNPTIFHFYKGIRYEFSTQAHLQSFKANPGSYEPAYGGWCAYAMGKTGEKVEVDPLKYKLADGKLYLFYYSIINNTLDKWNKDESRLKTEADKNWNKTLNHK